MTVQNSKLTAALVAVVLMSGISMSASFAANQAPAAHPVQLAAADAVTDDTITASAKAALSADAQSAALPVAVQTKAGVILLSGNVPSAEAGDRVVQIVASVAGVKEVRNDLRVKAEG